MIKNFKKEIDLISTSENINDKLMILSLYNEFYNAVLGSVDDNFIRHYAPFMEKTFELAVASVNLAEKGNITAEQFMRVYFEPLKKSMCSNMPQVKDIIASFETRLNDYIDRMGYVGIIDQFESISLSSKVSIMTQFREYINHVFCTTLKLFDEKRTKELRHNILDMLSNKLGEYLKGSLAQDLYPYNLFDNLKPIIMISTKEYLMDKLASGEFGFEDIQDEIAREFFAKFNEQEQKIWLINAIYVIAGYDKNDESQEEQRIGEICQLLGISKFEYTNIALSMVVSSLNILPEINSETIGDDSPNQGRN